MNAQELNATWLDYIEVFNCRLEEGKLDPDKYRRIARKLIEWEDNAIRLGVMRIG